MSKSISDTIELLTGKKPSEKELSEITRIAKVLEIEEDDIFLKFLAIEHHQNSLMNDIPEKILKSCHTIIDDAEEILLDKKNSLNISGILLSIIFIIIAIYTSITCFLYGKDEGVKEGISLARNHNAFVETKFFDDIYKLYESGELQAILYCEKEGWYKNKNGYCYPNSFEKDGKTMQLGWRYLNR